MSLFRGPEEHTTNPPDTWVVERVGPRRWHVRTATGATLDHCTTRREAEGLCRAGFLVDLYAKEARWYAGEPVEAWRPWAEIEAARRASPWR